MLLLPLLSIASAVAAVPHSSNSQTYDYIVVGGGTSGLVVANRLSESSDVSVLVIEAGASVYDNSAVTNVDGYGEAFGSAIDWQYETINQTYAGGAQQVLRAGKALGGTSTINGMAYTRAEDIQIDAWEKIGNEGWTWDSLLPYYKKSQNLTLPTKDQVAAGARYDPAVNGEDGPGLVGFLDMEPSNLTTALNRTFQNTGVPWTADVNTGKMRGYNVFPSTIDYEEYVREDAARAYYWPYEERSNLHVLVNTTANRLVWKNQDGGNATADGVEITSSDGTASVVHAKNEVVISAGSLRSPLLLELSGVGNPSILNQFNIPVRVNLPTVGENLQDQMNAHMDAQGYQTLSGIKSVSYPSISDVFGNASSTWASSIKANLADWAAATAQYSNNTMSKEVLQHLFELQYDLIVKNQIPIAEILVYPSGGKVLASEFWTLLPFARGNIHITSANASAPARINPNFGMFDWDFGSLTGIAKYIRKLFQTAPLKQFIQTETTPGFSTISATASDETWDNWAKSTYRSNFHPVGTAAMMPRNIGGVVDNRLRVYGTNNVRVVDASVLPFQVCGHLVSTLYAVAERASDLIKADASA